MARSNDEIRIRIIAGAIIQFFALVVLAVIVFIDSHDSSADYNQVELLLVGIAAAPPAQEIIKRIKNGKYDS